MTTERIVEAAATMLETWADHLRTSAALAYDQIERGDPDGHGINFLKGSAATYNDVAAALQASADDVRGRRVPPEGPLLRAVPSPSEEKEA